MVVGRRSEQALYDEALASFGDDAGAYDHADAAGFIRLFGLPVRAEAERRARTESASSRPTDPGAGVRPPTAAGPLPVAGLAGGVT